MSLHLPTGKILIALVPSLLLLLLPFLTHHAKVERSEGEFTITLLCSCNPLTEPCTWDDEMRCRKLSENATNRFTVYHNCKTELFLKDYAYKNGVLHLYLVECGVLAKCGNYVNTYEVKGLRGLKKITVDVEYVESVDECIKRGYRPVAGVYKNFK